MSVGLRGFGFVGALDGGQKPLAVLVQLRLPYAANLEQCLPESAAFVRRTRPACGPRTRRMPGPSPHARSSFAGPSARRRAARRRRPARSRWPACRIGLRTLRTRDLERDDLARRPSERLAHGASAPILVRGAPCRRARPGSCRIRRRFRDRPRRRNIEGQRLGGNRWCTRISAWHRALRDRPDVADRSPPTRRRTTDSGLRGSVRRVPPPRRSHVRNCRDCSAGEERDGRGRAAESGRKPVERDDGAVVQAIACRPPERAQEPELRVVRIGQLALDPLRRGEQPNEHRRARLGLATYGIGTHAGCEAPTRPRDRRPCRERAARCPRSPRSVRPGRVDDALHGDCTPPRRARARDTRP